MIKVNDPLFQGFSTECKVIFTCRKYPMTLLNDSDIYKAEFSRLYPDGFPDEDKEFLIIPISETETILMTFLLCKVYQKKNNENWKRRKHSYFRKRDFSIDDEYITLKGLIHLGLTPEEEHDERVSERFDFIVIFKRNPMLVKVFNKIFNLRLD